MYDAKEILACGKDGDPEPMQRLQDLVNKYYTISCIINFIYSQRIILQFCSPSELHGRNAVFQEMENIYVLVQPGSTPFMSGNEA